MKRLYLSFLSLSFSSILFAQPDRLPAAIGAGRPQVQRGMVHPLARAEYDRGVADPSTAIQYATLYAKPSAAQQTALERLLAEQQTPSSPRFRKWLTPEEYADRFGLSPRDAAKVAAWLKSQGLTVHDVARGRHWITFSGTAGTVGRALHTEFHRYFVDGEMHLANATEPSVPAELAGIVSGFEGLNDFRDRSSSRAVPAYTISGAHYMGPDDFATIYNLKPLYQAGIDGTGHKIAIIGRTNISLSDIRSFRTAFGLPANDPQLVLFGSDPGSNADDEGEADLDLEWSGAVARGAQIYYVYATSVRTAAQYAVDQAIAPVMSFSYGSCELVNTTAFRAVAQQAAAQGITWMACAGDSGAAGCDPAFSTANPLALKGPGVWFPAVIPEITAVGGTMFNEAGGSYWASTNNRATLGSALSYIPEIAWSENNGPLGGLAAGGGGASMLFSKPGWQTGPGVPDDKARDVPDLSLSAAFHDGYFTVSRGSAVIFTGTSASSPSFAGIVALLNQYLVSNKTIAQPGLGNINPTLYRMAVTTPAAFHDVTSGDSMTPCPQEEPGCANGSIGYRAAPGYDLATGLGSVDANNLITQWNTSTSPSTTRLSSSAASAAYNSSLTLTARVSGQGGTPTGTVSFTAADVSLGSAALSGSGGTANATLTVSVNQLPVGSDTIWAVYGGDTAFDGSANSAAVSVGLPASGSAVVPSISPVSVLEAPPNSQGYRWYFTLTLKEVAGVSTTLTGFTFDGVAGSLSSFFSTTSISAKGSISTSLAYSTLTVPSTHTFGFTGQDASGQTWSQQISATFYGPELSPWIALSIPGAAVLQDPNADPSCQWSHPLQIQELGGYNVQLTKLTAGTQDLTGQIQQVFGTTRLAPWGTLQGTICWGGLTPPQTLAYTITGTPDGSGSVSATASASIGASPVKAATASVSPASLQLSTADASGTATATVALNFAGNTPQWTATVFPSGRNGSWLQVSPTSGTGPAQLTVKAVGTGLSPGAYLATVTILTVGGTPEYLSVPVAYTVAPSSTTTIGGLLNGFSNQPAFAPGAWLSIYGTQLARTTSVATSLPLPYTMDGVSATVNGVSAPIWFISPGQLNVQIPYEIAAGPALVAVDNNGQVASAPFTVAASAPGLYAAFFSLTGQKVTSAKAGDILLAFVTGDGDMNPASADGAAPAATTDASKLPMPRLTHSLTVGGVAAQEKFHGIPLGVTAESQIDFVVPANVPLGPQPVVVTVGGVASPPVTLTITQ
jgi:uncharacterized protein (TIGR03437 family)